MFCENEALLGDYMVACLFYEFLGRSLDDSCVFLEEFSLMID